MRGKILFCGDNHTHIRHIIKAVKDKKPDAVVLLGDIEPKRPLEEEPAPILGPRPSRLRRQRGWAWL